MRPTNVLTGEVVDYPSPEERQRRRIARMRHIVWLAVNSMYDEQQAVGGRLVMLTLTYKGVKDWSPRHISGCCRWLRDQQVKSYLWVAELQRRGAVHYHVLGLYAKGQRWIKPSASNGGWSRGHTWVTDDIRFPWYVMKYCQKGSKDGYPIAFPKGLRLYGVSQWCVRRMSFQDATDYRAAQVPAWFRGGATDSIDMRRAYRSRLGVGVGSLVAVSPFVRSLPIPVVQIAWRGYTEGGTSANHAGQ